MLYNSDMNQLILNETYYDKFLIVLNLYNLLEVWGIMM